MQFFVLGEDESLTAKIRTQLVDRGFECPANHVLTPEQLPVLLQTLKAAAPSPGAATLARLIVVVLGPDIERSLKVIAPLQALGGVQVLAAGPATDPKLVIRAMREGANEYLDVNDLDSELLQAMRRLEDERGAGRALGLLSACGGSGVSTIAVNLACAFAASLKGQHCALLDLKVEGGDLASLLDLKPGFSLADICRNAETIDFSLLRGTLSPHRSGVELLASPAKFPSFGEVSARGAARALALSRHHFPWVIADLDRCLSNEAYAVAQSVDALVMIVRLDFVSLRKTRLMREFLETHGIPAPRIHLVANRVGLPGEIPIAQAEEAVGSSITLQIPDEPKTALRGVNHGEPFVFNAPSARVSRKITELATLAATWVQTR